MQKTNITASARVQENRRKGCARITFVDHGSSWDSRVRFHHRGGGFYELSARDVGHWLDLLFRRGNLRARLHRLYGHARKHDILTTHYYA